jgi:asparagine synthetase B (glutamine-hydrolysing)
MAGRFEEFRANVKAHDGRIGIAVSGGLDSAAVLHELRERNGGLSITAFCLKQGDASLEYQKSKAVAESYGVNFRYWDFNSDEYYAALRECMAFFDRPRWNVWPYVLMKMASRESVRTFYIGEGSDEIFGYRDRCYLKGWISQLEYIFPVWSQSAKHFGIELHSPFLELEHSLDRLGLPNTLSYFCGNGKDYLWEEYRDRLKAQVIYPKLPCVDYYGILGKGKDDLLKIATRYWLDARL